MKNNLKGYGQYYRSGMSMKEKWADERRLVAEKRECELTRQKVASGISMMGRNEK